LKVQQLESFLTNAGVRNYLFVRLTADNGLTGIGEASLEWQEKAVQTVLHDWVERRILGQDPFDIEAIAGAMLRDQYQGGPTVLTAISGVEIALWDLMGKACGQPVYRLLGGRARERLPAYANGWYGGAATPAEFAERAREVVDRGYRALKFDPFGTAWKEMTAEEMDLAEARVAEVRRAVGPRINVLIEGHGRLSVPSAIQIGLRLARYEPTFFEEPVTPHSLELLQQVQRALPYPLAAGERLYTLEDFYRFSKLRPADVLQPDLCHIGGLHMGKKIAAMAQAQDIRLAPHVSIGPVALCAALHFGWSTPGVWMQESFSEYDIPWRNDFVCGWEPTQAGTFRLPEGTGLGIELDTAVCQAHPYVEQPFPSLWEQNWVAGFTRKEES
jgi:galactonate dehydratase